MEANKGYNDEQLQVQTYWKEILPLLNTNIPEWLLKAKYVHKYQQLEI